MIGCSQLCVGHHDYMCYVCSYDRDCYYGNFIASTLVLESSSLSVPIVSVSVSVSVIMRCYYHVCYKFGG